MVHLSRLVNFIDQQQSNEEKTTTTDIERTVYKECILKREFLMNCTHITVNVIECI